MKLTIKITKDVLRESANCLCEPYCDSYDDWMKRNFRSANCAISKAVSEIFPQAVTNYNQIEMWNVWSEGYLTAPDFIIPIPNKASVFIHQFDRLPPEQRANMPEVSFEIEVPDSIIEKIGIDQVHATLKESKTLSLIDN